MKKLVLFFGAILLSCSSTPKHDEAVFPVEEAAYVKKWQERNLAQEKHPQYKITGTCDGLPKINVKTAPGFCVGIIDNGENMVFPRTAVETDKKNLLVVDMGGWADFNGRIYSLKYSNGKYQRSTLLHARNLKNPAKKPALDKPHLIQKGPDGLMYIGAAGTISRFNPKAQDIESSLELIITDIPKQGLHPLKAFAFDDQGNLFVNVGSATNVCQKDGLAKASSCKEAELTEAGQALIRQYDRQADGTYSANYKIYARGLRNSMGLYWNQSNQVLMQIENGRDDISYKDSNLSNLNFPHEELNLVREGKHYGWPYCYDNNVANPEWSHINCEQYEKPFLLLPQHSSPLSILNYQGSMFPNWYKNRFIMSLHGYEARGHRIVTFLRNDDGLPTGKPLSIVYGWDPNGEQLIGTPVGLTEMSDGSIVLAEDYTRKILRLFYDPKLGDGKPINEIPDVVTQSPDEKLKSDNLKSNLKNALNGPNAPAFAKVQDQMIDKHCASCHSGADARGMQLNAYDFVNNEARILKKGKAQAILTRIKGGDSAMSQMPPDGFSSEQEKQEIVNLYMKWLQTVNPK